MTNRMKSAIWINGNKLVMNYPQFNGGERNIRITESFLNIGEDTVSVYALLFDSSAVMDLLLVCDAVRRMGVRSIDLTIPYLPYARQDRVMVSGEALSVKVFASLINSIEAHKVTIYDCHSDVGVSLIDNCVNISQEELIYKCLNINDEGIVVGCSSANDFVKYTSDVVIVAPDRGAMKKAYNIAKSAVNAKLECAGKLRDVSTGDITGITFNPNESIDGKNCLIPDDISDAGGTFYYLGQHIKENNNPKNIGLIVTHGIFAKGAEYLYEYLDDVFTIDYNNPNELKIVRLDK